MSYECHVTCTLKDAEYLEIFAKDNHWKTSEIKRDPILGDNSYFYLTAHSNDLQTLIGKMDNAVSDLWFSNVEVKRKKIEAILIDVRF